MSEDRKDWKLIEDVKVGCYVRLNIPESSKIKRVTRETIDGNFVAISKDDVVHIDKKNLNNKNEYYFSIKKGDGREYVYRDILNNYICYVKDNMPYDDKSVMYTISKFDNTLGKLKSTETELHSTINRTMDSVKMLRNRIDRIERNRKRSAWISPLRHKTKRK